MTQPELTSEQVEKWRSLLEGKHVVLSPVDIGRYDLVALCSMALAHLRSQPAGYVSVPRERLIAQIAAWTMRYDVALSLEARDAMLLMLAASPPAGEGADTFDKYPRNSND